MDQPPIPRLQRMFAALKNRNYRLFWTGQLISLVGTWMQTVAMSWLVLELTNSAFILGLVTAVQFTPILILSLFGGVLADRFPKRNLLLATQTTMLLQATALAVLTSTNLIQLPHVFILAAVLGFATAVDTPTRQAFVMEMVGAQDLANAVALNSTEFNLARLLGPAIGGITIATIGIAGSFYANAASYLAVIGSLILIRSADLFQGPRAERGGSWIVQITEGLRYARSTPDVLLVFIILAMIGTFGYNFSVILPLIAKNVLQSGAFGLGVLTSAIGVGSLISALGIAYSGKASVRGLLGGAVAFTILLLGVAVSSLWATIVPLLVGLGMASILFSATANTRLQLVTPPVLRGRVMSIYSLLFLGTTPIGSFTTGTLAEVSGVQPAIAELAGLCAVGVIAGLIYARRALPRLPAGPG